MSDVWKLSALELARKVRAWEVSPVELAEIFLERIERYEPHLHAFIQLQPEVTLRDARAREQELSGDPERLGAFHGVPIAVKDMNLAAGWFTRIGSRCFAKMFSPKDDTTVRELRAAGFVVLGKTTVPELATLPHCESELHPPTRNPWHPEYSPGGSSGGAGAALAAGLTPIAQGSDGGGSIRIPSALNALYGFKPSRGRIPNILGLPDTEILYGDGPMAHSVDDAAALLDVMCGIPTGRTHWASPPLRPFAVLARERPRRLRIRWTTRSPFATTHPEVQTEIERVARTLEELGHVLEEGTYPDGDPEHFLDLWKATAAQVELPDPHLLEPINQWLAAEGRTLSPERVRESRRKMIEPALAFVAGVDLLLTPTIPCEPLRIGDLGGIAPRAMIDRAVPIATFTAPFNVTGQPAASIPIAISTSGFPIAAQIVGHALDDALVLQVSRELEEALPWSRLHPRGYGW